MEQRKKEFKNTALRAIKKKKTLSKIALKLCLNEHDELFKVNKIDIT